MKRTNAKILPLLLACILSVSALSGCGKEETPQNPVDGAVEKRTLATPLDVDSLDFGNREITILVREDASSAGQFQEDASEFDVVNSAVSSRNAEVEENLGVILTVNPVKGGNWNAEMNKLIETQVNGDSHNFDLISNFAYYGSALAMNGYYYDWNRVGNVYTDKSYWNQSFIQESVIRDRMYMAVNDTCLSALKNTFVTFFNKELMADFHADVNLYELVEDGTWTFETFSQLVKDVYRDEDGEEGATAGDLYGLYTSVSSQNIDAYFYGLGLHYCTLNEEKQPEISLCNDLSISVFESLRDFLFSGSGVFVNGTNTVDHYVGARLAFAEGRSLFGVEPMADGAVFTANNLKSFGVLPLPKADESDDYSTSAQDSYDFLALPSNINNAEKGLADVVGAVTEYMACLSAEDVKPVYFETVIQSRLSDSPEDAKMYRAICGSVHFDFGAVYSACIQGTGVHLGHFWPNIFQTMFNAKNYSYSFSTEYEKYETSYGKQLSDVVDMLME